MKKIISVFAIVLAICIPSLLFAQDAGVPTSITSASQVLSPEEIIKLREQLKQMGTLVGATSASPVDKTKSAEEHKTVGDVADKALDMFSGVVASLANNIQKIAPHLWRIMIIQQYTKAAGDLVVPFGCLIIAVGYLFIIRKKWALYPKEQRTTKVYESYYASTEWVCQVIFRQILAPAAVVITSLIFLAYLSDSIKYIINPEYYAIKDLLNLILSGR